MLSECITKSLVAVVMKEVNSYTMFVLGEVAKRGKYLLKTKTNLLEAIKILGGFAPVAARTRLLVYLKWPKPVEKLAHSYGALVLRYDFQQSIELLRRDTIVVLSENMVLR